MERSYAWPSLARVARGASGRPSVCLAISASDRIAGLSDRQTNSLNYNWHCAYANEFPSQLKTSTWTNRGAFSRGNRTLWRRRGMTLAGIVLGI